jgi:hypothetical protein
MLRNIKERPPLEASNEVSFEAEAEKSTHIFLSLYHNLIKSHNLKTANAVSDTETMF